MTPAHRAIALPLAGFAILLSGCNEPASSEPANSVQVTEIPASLSGELTSQSPVNVNDGSRNQSFELQLEADTLYRIVSSGSLNQPTLLVLAEDNRLVSGPRAEQLYIQPEQSGTYRLALSGQSASDFGPFRIAVSTSETTNEGELEAGADILGRLQAGSGTGIGSGNRYTLKVAEKGVYELVLRSSEFDTVLKLRGKGVNQADDDGAGGTDSRVLAALEPGSYQLTAAGIDAGDEGVYSLVIQTREMPEGIDLSDGQQLEPGREYSGVLFGQSQAYQLVIAQPGLLQLSMNSDDLDSVLEVTGPGVSVRDDDSGGNQDALISVAVEPGTYRIKAAQYGAGEGLFTLKAELSEVSVLAGEITPGEVRTGRLTAGQPAAVRLQIAEAGVYRMILRSSEFDALLTLQGAGVEEQDDDSAGGTNAQLEVHLEPGEYELRPGTYGDEGTGSFVLEVSSPL